MNRLNAAIKLAQKLLAYKFKKIDFFSIFCSSAAADCSPPRIASASRAGCSERTSWAVALHGPAWREKFGSRLPAASSVSAGWPRATRMCPALPARTASADWVWFGLGDPLGDFRFFCWGITTQKSISVGEIFGRGSGLVVGWRTG